MNLRGNKELDHYIKLNKFIRDHIHEYVFLTDFELSLVDTIEFQRLKDIRQLTCQHVYPGARHTRFEHSLGVMELTRRAIDAINRNGYISKKEFDGPLLDDHLKFNGILAALLHDVGHCPFSHLGEREFDKDEVWKALYEDIEEKLLGTDFQQQLAPLDIRGINDKPAPKGKELRELRKKYPGAPHEQLSCCVILENLFDRLAQVKDVIGDKLSVDFELICRCILGMEYDTSLEVYSSNQEKYELNRKKNIIVHLINSHAFDMDKLDYVMRDSWMTGIGAPIIDTNRLFRNMYLSDDYTIVFSSRAVPALQNMIDSRDELYMYVYNHHAVIFSDFMYTYIFRRLAHNARDLNNLLNLALNETAPEDSAKQLAEKSLVEDSMMITNLGSVAKEYLFSPGSILDENRSDGDLTSLLNVVHSGLKSNQCNRGDCELLLRSLTGFIDIILSEIVNDDVRDKIRERLSNCEKEDNHDKLCEEAMRYLSKIKHTYELVDRYMRRDNLKPWWKTYSEFNLFINHNFPSDNIRRKLCDWICNGADDEPAGDEFRSQLAKHVAYITHNPKIASELCRPLKQGDFFVIERSAKFFDPQTLKEFEIAQKTNEITGDPGSAKYHLGDYYIKELPQIIPQKDYYSVYARNSFYVFSRRIEHDQDYTPKQERHHYQLIEQIFVFVATELVNQGKRSFQSRFGKEIHPKNKSEFEKESLENLCSRFIEKHLWNRSNETSTSSDGK